MLAHLYTNVAASGMSLALEARREGDAENGTILWYLEHAPVEPASSWRAQVSSLKSTRVWTLESRPTAIVAPTDILIRGLLDKLIERGQDNRGYSPEGAQLGE